MKSAGSLIEPVALNVNKIVTLFFDFFIPGRGPVDNVLEGSNFQYNPKINAIFLCLKLYYLISFKHNRKIITCFITIKYIFRIEITN